MPISHSAVANIISPPPYITTIPLTEAPISEGGIYTLGGTHALDWQDPQTTGGTPGVAYVNGTSPGQATDNLASSKGNFRRLDISRVLPSNGKADTSLPTRTRSKG
jgi:hypothetical protein